MVIDVPALLRGAGAADGSFLFGTGAPATTLGIDGDAYLDTDAGTIYKKASSAWTAAIYRRRSSNRQRCSDSCGLVSRSGSHSCGAYCYI